MSQLMSNPLLFLWLYRVYIFLIFHVIHAITVIIIPHPVFACMGVCRIPATQVVRNCRRTWRSTFERWRWWFPTGRSLSEWSWPAAGFSRMWCSPRSFTLSTSCARSSSASRQIPTVFSPVTLTYSIQYDTLMHNRTSCRCGLLQLAGPIVFSLISREVITG